MGRLGLPFLVCCFALMLGLSAGPARAEEPDGWILVAAPAFRDAVKPLEEHRRSQGLRVVRIDLDGQPVDAVSLRASIHEAASKIAGTTSVLLVGAVGVEGEDAKTVVPAFQGTVERMRGQPTDRPYGRLSDEASPGIAVGRFPALTVEHAQAMVEKTIRFEAQSGPRPHRFDIGLIVGHPGGASAMEKRFASSFVRTEITPRFRAAHPRWRTTAIVHMQASPFCVPNEELDTLARDLLTQDRLLTVFLGHSGPRGLWSEGRDFVVGEAWSAWEGDVPKGVLLSCGCYTCQLAGLGGVGYGLRSVRSTGGHVAVVGAHQVSYGAMGKLAFGGVVPMLQSDEPPTRLGDWYLAMMRGLAKGKIGYLTFMLYDKADGSGGTVPLATQRKEHLEMWMLLGDPALRLPLEKAGIEIDVEGEASPGATLQVRGTLPPSLGAESLPVLVTVERAFGMLPADAPALPSEPGTERDAAMRERHALANDPVVLSQSVRSKDGHFEATLTLPAVLPGKSVRIRATVSTPERHATEAVRLMLKP